MNMKRISFALAAAVAGIGLFGEVSAADLAVVPGTSSPSISGATITGVQLVASNTSTNRGWNLTLQLPVGVSATNVVGATGSGQPLGAIGSCSYASATNRIIVLAGELTGTVASGTACTFDLVFPASAAGTQFVIEEFSTPGCVAVSGSCTSQVTDAFASGDLGTPGVPEAHVATSVAAPVPLTLSYSPAAGSTITFAAGATPGTAAPNQTINVTATGTTGTASLTGCAISGAGASAFSVSPTSLSFSAAGTQSLTVGCTYPTSNASATLTCRETDADSSNEARSWSLSCPAPNVNPTLASNPASGSTVTVGGVQAGQQATTTIDLSASGGSGSGSATISCTSTGAVQIAFGGAPSGQGPINQTVTGANQPIDLVVGVTLTAGPQDPAGTITCDVNDGTGPRQFTYTVNALPGVVPPEVIPASSLWSQLGLIGLMLGLGGLLLIGRRTA